MIVPHAALRTPITIEDAAGAGALGETFGEPRDVWASVQEIQRMAEDEMGNETVIDTLIIIRPEAGPVAPKSRITIDSDKYRVIKAFPIPDRHSPSHWELLVRLWGVVENGSV